MMLLMRLLDAACTKFLLVSLPEETPVSRAYVLQNELRRVGIEPYTRVVHKSKLAAGTSDPSLEVRLWAERSQTTRLAVGS